jgi:hypothetical protein
MTINLAPYKSIETALLCKIQVDYYKASAGATATAQTLLFSDYWRPITYASNTYLGLGRLLNVSATTSELKNTSNNITMAISGIPNSSIDEIVNSRIKGSKIEIYRYFFNASTQQFLNIPDNPAGRFFGYVSNYSLDEEYDVVARQSLNSITLSCVSQGELLSNKKSGRKTNPKSQKSFFPFDLSMDRVPNLIGANFDFGVPK